MSLYQDPESRSKRKPEPSAPLFEQSFYKFEQHKVADQLSRVVIGKRDKEDGVPREYAPSSPAQVSCGHGARRESATELGQKAPLLETPAGIQFEQSHARRNDPATSKAAARSVVNLGRTRDAILRILRTIGPATDEQIQDKYAQWKRGEGLSPASPSGLRSRRSELVTLGFVEACGEGKTVSGRPCQIWRLK